ncbi:phosphoadenylyl-sulfate reductase [Novosphingobium sp.]|uniref:phosphoadenylyl-sulfate reductase n=1 Tax=Novosphingobium sp. TaxID=1874826 RepID=UPI0022BD5B67|nr:phosphoadenylyl-sulfate reductase [Novosphingobium sp.]MCZ8019315.1 phosphoadenylyl-sulfate reductase [Novosphingobium sp.]MCZ8035130.1 phosphoadenylyl-sulfate reductase [Novosphingobium sp.]MCZ8050444.1 phosphoadenylyl-sulfate reductase [Novosphingobium sp.]MCZ8058790.1 phosphoadenylyl-sulfate reductase [Novosphingobium sp.]MCZ8232235.1 phosphoadenylyl-sulfate reductase [Novosphingobium sp.]
MAEAQRQPDVIDTAPAFVQADADALNARFAGVDTGAMLTELLAGELKGRIAIVSSFGAESAALLHLVAAVDKTVPLIFINTQKMFGETLAYRDELAERLGFTDLRVFRPDPYDLAARDQTGLRWSYDPDGCCDIRKVRPLRRALAPFDAWISGRKAFQAKSRAALPRFEIDEGRLKLNPLADWSKEQLEAYIDEHKLPRHPLVAQGYPSIGCSPCTSKVGPGEDPRSGRWKGWEKTECGIHGEASASELPPGYDPAF